MAHLFSTPLRVAVIGTGYFSQFQCAAWQRMPDVELVALHALDKTQGQAMQKQFGFAQLFSDISTLLDQSGADVIDIVTPSESHADIITQCVKQNKTVICQKPFCRSFDEAKQIATFAQEKNVLVVVHENFRFQPWYLEIKRIIDEGQLGELYEINFDLRPGDGQGPTAYLDRQPYFQTQERFLVQETGVHFIDVFRYLLSDEVSGLFAKLATLNPVNAGEDAGVIVMDFNCGVRGILNANRLCDHAATNTRRTMGEMRVEGSAGTLYLNGDGQIHLRKHGSNAITEQVYQWNDTDFGGDCTYNTQRHIADHLLYRKPVHNAASDYLTNRRVEEAVYKSAETGCWIAM